MSRAGTPYLALELRDRTGRDPGARVPRRRRGWRRASSAATSCACAARVERFRDELQLERARDRQARRGEADPAAFLPVAYRDLDELDGFLEHLAREVHDPGYAGCSQLLLGDARCAPPGAARRARAAATTPTSAACSSTPSPSARSRSRPAQLHPRLNPTC